MPSKKKTTKSPSRLKTPVVLADDVLQLTARLQTSIDKLTDATTRLSEGVSVHTQRISTVEEQYKQQQVDYRALQDEHSADYKFLNERITTVQRELTEKMAENTASVTQHIDQSLSKFADTRRLADEAIYRRLSSLEKWRWMIAGGSVILSLVLSAVLLKIVEVVLSGIDWSLVFRN